MTPAEQIRREYCRLAGMNTAETEENIRGYPLRDEGSEQWELDNIRKLQEEHD